VNASNVHTRILYRWHPHQLFSRLEPNGKEYLSPDKISMGSESELEESEEDSRDPTDLDELQELFKGFCAPRPDEAIDEVTGRVVTSGRHWIALKEPPAVPRTRSLQECLSVPATARTEREVHQAPYRRATAEKTLPCGPQNCSENPHMALMPYHPTSAREVTNHYTSNWVKGMAGEWSKKDRSAYSLSSSSESRQELCRS
jgi:hypothetical protein